MIDNNFDIPIMYRDLGESLMPVVPPMSFGTMLNDGIRIKPQLDYDKVQIMNKKNNEGIQTFKKALTALALIGGVCFVPSLFKKSQTPTVFKYAKEVFSYISSRVKNFKFGETFKSLINKSEQKFKGIKNALKWNKKFNIGEKFQNLKNKIVGTFKSFKGKNIFKKL